MTLCTCNVIKKSEGKSLRRLRSISPPRFRFLFSETNAPAEDRLRFCADDTDDTEDDEANGIDTGNEDEEEETEDDDTVDTEEDDEDEHDDADNDDDVASDEDEDDDEDTAISEGEDEDENDFSSGWSINFSIFKSDVFPTKKNTHRRQENHNDTYETDNGSHKYGS